MSCLNRMTVIGYLGADPELQEANGKHRVSFSVAATESWKDARGDKRERTEWFRVSSWGAGARAISEHLRKGSRVFVEGRIRTYRYTDKQGQERDGMEVDASRVMFLDRPGDRSA